MEAPTPEWFEAKQTELFMYERALGKGADRYSYTGKWPHIYRKAADKEQFNEGGYFVVKQRYQWEVSWRNTTAARPSSGIHKSYKNWPPFIRYNGDWGGYGAAQGPFENSLEYVTPHGKAIYVQMPKQERAKQWQERIYALFYAEGQVKLPRKRRTKKQIEEERQKLWGSR